MKECIDCGVEIPSGVLCPECAYNSGSDSNGDLLPDKDAWDY